MWSLVQIKMGKRLIAQSAWQFGQPSHSEQVDVYLPRQVCFHIWSRLELQRKVSL